jgi:ADP-heptose:LPS heptosyltransferase
VKILLLQIKRIGDLIQTTPAISCLREKFPDATLSLVVDSSCEGLLDSIDVDERFVFRKGEPNQWMKSLRGEKPDWCLDFTGTDRSAFLSFYSGAKRRVAFDRFRKKFLRRFIYSDFVDSSIRERHTADHYTDLLKPLGIAKEGVPLSLKIQEPVRHSAMGWLIAEGVAGQYAVVHAGTARSEKYWLPDRWAKVINHLGERHGLKVVLTGSRDPVEQAHLGAIRAEVKQPIADLSGKTGLSELAAVIGGAKIFLGVDTAAMHLADAMKVPSIALFGPTNPFHWRPRFSKSIVLRADTAEPFKPGQKGGPMGDVALETVVAASDQILS